MTLRSAVMLLTLALLLSEAPRAAADPPADWQAGQDAFAAGDIASALVFFTSARDQGLAGPAVHYNIAVCHYELGDYAAARDTFALIAARFPSMRGLAEYNVGLAMRRLGDPVAAQRRFIAAWYASEDPKVRALAASQLTELDSDEPDDPYGSVSLGFGHDDNVALRDRLGLPAGVGDESSLAELFAMLTVPFAGAAGLAFDASLYAITYPDAGEFDQAELRAGAVYSGDTGGWHFGTGLHVVTGTLDGSRLNEELNADFSATYFVSAATSIEMRVRYDEIRGASAIYAGIDGSRSRADVRFRWYRFPHYVVLRGGIEDNDRRDAGISPTRQRLQARYYRQLGDRWEIEAEASMRVSAFDGIAVPREEDLATVALGASYELAAGWDLGVRWRYSENDSSDPVYSYERHQIAADVRYLFQP